MLKSLFPHAKPAGEVLVLGELLLDFVPERLDMRLAEAGAVIKTVSGSAGIFACAAASMGVPCGFIGKVGADAFSELALRTIQEAGVDTSRVVRTDQGQIGLAFVEYLPGSRNYQYYRDRSAGSQLGPEDLREESIRSAQILHLPGMLLELNETMREACFRAVEIARDNHVLVSFDPNLRKELQGSSAARERMLRMIGQADILSPTLSEAQEITGYREIPDVLRCLHDQGPKLIALTRDKDGAVLSDGQKALYAGGIDVPVVDPTGAGDTFAAALACCVSENADIERTTRFCNCAGTLVCMKRGAIGMAIPTRQEIQELMDSELCAAAGYETRLLS